MKALTCLLIFGIFGKIQTINQDKAKSVTLALETILEFDKKDNAVDLHFIDQIQTFLNNVKHLIDKNHLKRKHIRRSNDNRLTFIDFVTRALDILKKYDDDDLNNLVRIMDNEVRKYHYKGCKFHELLENHEVRRFVANILDTFKSRPINDIRQDIKNFLQNIGQLGGDEKNFIKYVNSLYRYSDMSKFEAFLNNLDSYSNKFKRAELNLGKIIQDGIRSIIFDHYSDLKPNVRNDFKIKLEAFWTDHKKPGRTYHERWGFSVPNIMRTFSFNPPKVEYTTKKKLTNKPLNMDAFNHYYDKIDLFKTLKQFIGNIKKDSSEEKKYKKKKRPQTNFEPYDIDKKSDFVSSRENKKSHELKIKKHRKKHKRQGKHKNKEKSKHKYKSTETFEKAETKSKWHYKKHTLSGRDRIPVESMLKKGNEVKIKKRHPKIKVTVPIERTQWRETVKYKKKMKTLKDKDKVKTFNPIRNDVKRTHDVSSLESLEGNESFNRHREIADLASNEYKSPESSGFRREKQKEDSRKWFTKHSTTSHEGMSIESYEFAKKYSLSRKVNDNDSLLFGTVPNTHMETKINIVEDTTPTTIKYIDLNMNDVTYDELDFWTSTTKFDEVTAKIKKNTTKVIQNTTMKQEKTMTTSEVEVTTASIVIRQQNDTVTEPSISFLNKTIGFVKPSNVSQDMEGDLEDVKTDNSTLAAKTKLVLNSYFNQSQALDGVQKQKVRLQMREDINNILGKTMEATTMHDDTKSDPFKELEDIADIF